MAWSSAGRDLGAPAHRIPLDPAVGSECQFSLTFRPLLGQWLEPSLDYEKITSFQALDWKLVWPVGSHFDCSSKVKPG